MKKILKHIEKIVNYRLLGVPIYIWLIMLGFAFNTLNYYYGYIFYKSIGWIITGMGTLFFIIYLFKS